MITTGLIIILWNLIGLFFIITWGCSTSNSYLEYLPFRLFNPKWIYRTYYSVNWFGAALINLFCIALCPIGAIVYWICVLSTIGRK